MRSIFTERKNLVSKGETVSQWSVRPFQLVSFLEMLKKYASTFHHFGVSLARLSLLSEKTDVTKDKPLIEASYQSLTRSLASLRDMCKEMGLEQSVLGVERVLRLSNEELTYSSLKDKLPELQRRIEDELKSTLFMHVPTKRADYYSTDPLFGPKVAQKFAKGITDIQEAGKCFALGRYTACVFHLMRVMERGVQRLGRKLQVSIPVEEKDWGLISNHINGALRRQPNSTVQEKKVHARYAKAAVYLDNVREAWRNETMHPKETYTEEEAEDCLRFVKQYMEFLAKIL